ncbi:uncharacterized protein BJ212DRAFT_1322466, partial [Suillus subaureus]
MPWCSIESGVGNERFDLGLATLLKSLIVVCFFYTGTFENPRVCCPCTCVHVVVASHVWSALVAASAQWGSTKLGAPP